MNDFPQYSFYYMYPILKLTNNADIKEISTMNNMAVAQLRRSFGC